MAEEGALAERALTPAWDAFEERFSWEYFSDLRLLGRLCLCSRALATVNTTRLIPPFPPREDVQVLFARSNVFSALRTVKRQLLKRGWMRRKPRILSVDSRGICYMEVVNNLDWLGSDSSDSEGKGN